VALFTSKAAMRICKVDALAYRVLSTASQARLCRGDQRGSGPHCPEPEPSPHGGSLFTTPTNRAVRPAISEIMILVRGKLNNRDDVRDVTNRWSTSESFGDIVSGMEQLTELYT